SESASRFGGHFTGASKFAATGAHPRHRKRSIKGDACLLIASAITANETWKIYSHNRGHPFVDHVSFRARHSFKGGTGENKVQQKIALISRGPFVRCEFNRIHAGAVGRKSA